MWIRFNIDKLRAQSSCCNTVPRGGFPPPFHALCERTCRFSTKGTVWNADGPVCTFRWTEGQGDRRQTSTCLGLSGYPLHPRAASSSVTQVGRDWVGRSVCYVWQRGCARLAEEWERLIRKSEPQVACRGKEQASEWYLGWNLGLNFSSGNSRQDWQSGFPWVCFNCLQGKQTILFLLLWQARPEVLAPAQTPLGI